MASYRVSLKRTASKDLRGLPKDVLQRVQTHLDKLARQPRPPGARKVQGEEKMYRLRVGDYRIVYEIDDATRAVEVLFVRHRKDVYRLL